MPYPDHNYCTASTVTIHRLNYHFFKIKEKREKLSSSMQDHMAQACVPNWPHNN